jgi:hypothetical protein
MRNSQDRRDWRVMRLADRLLIRRDVRPGGPSRTGLRPEEEAEEQIGVQAVYYGTQLRAASNAKAKAELGLTLEYPSWREGSESCSVDRLEGWAENPGSGSAQGAEGGRWSQRARHVRFGSHRTAPHADDRRTAPPWCVAARHERIDPPPGPALHRAGRAIGQGLRCGPRPSPPDAVSAPQPDGHARPSCGDGAGTGQTPAPSWLHRVRSH